MGILKSKKGSSLIQVTIGLAIAIISGLAISTLIENTLKVQKSIEITDDFTNILSVVKMSLGTEAVCNLNISNIKNLDRGGAHEFNATALSGLKLQVDKIQNTAVNVIITNNQNLPGKHATLVKIYLTNLVEIMPNSQFIGDLQFELDKNNSTQQMQLGVKNIVRKIPINIKTTNSGSIQTITACSTPSMSLSAEDIKKMKSEMCASLDGTFDTATGKCDIGPYYQP